MAKGISRNLAELRMLSALVAAILPIVACEDLCSAPLYTKLQRRGFYCDNNTSKILQGLEFNYCKLYCLDRGSCAGLSYNFINRSCIFTFKHCLEVSKNPDYEITLFQPTQYYPCISWLNYRPARHLIRGYQGVARRRNENQWVPGKYAYPDRVACIVWGSSELCSEQGGEYLQVGDYCSVAWVPYTAGETITKGAVQGGTLSDGTPLYVVNLQIDAGAGIDGWAFGYYRLDNEMGYAGLHGMATRRDMEMLIVVW